MEEKEINFKAIEKKWQDKWEKAKIFEVSDKSAKKKFYVLEMFPYPSGEGLHMGHALNFTIGDVLARFKRMKGFNVLYPMGYDALGLPAENAAIKAKVHPQDYTDKAIKNYIRQQKELGLSYDWTRVVNTASPDYYKWDQWIFLKMFEKNLAYQKTAAVNFCTKCDTVLANEQVVNGKCWRHDDTDVEIKHLKQWFFKTTHYADELYENTDKLDWPERTKAMQKNWIGKSHGTEIDFEISKFGKEIKELEFVFLHAYGDTSQNAFWTWLKKEIESRGGKVAFVKDLPNTDNPKFEEQSEFLLKNYKFNEKSVVIAHSLGNILMMKILEKIKTKISSFIMVASPLPRSIEELKNGKAFKDLKPRPTLARYCDWKFNFNQIKSKVDKIIVLEDKKDHIVPEGDPKKLAELLDAEYILTTGNKTHFNAEIEEAVLNSFFKTWKIFTTRPDTIFGVTFMVVSAQHEKLQDLVTKEQKKAVEEFLKKIKTVSQKSMKDLDELNKEGVFTGSFAINPATNEKVPVYAGNFVVADYGSGMVMAVPAHDQRDFEFAKKYKIDVKVVINPEDYELNAEKMSRAFTNNGILVNSQQFNSTNNKQAIEKITSWLATKKKARKVVNFKLRDWLVSRQRYWGTPIPIIYCDKCGPVSVPEKDLPVKLPKNVKFGKGNPLLTAEDWVNVKCPKCSGKAKRETDTMDTFVNSSWYYLRYCDSKNNEKIFDEKKADYWCPIDQYIGGAEHACLHLIYARFYTKFLADLKLIKFREPAKKLFHQGMLAGEGGVKMSKSKGNVINPDAVSKKYGIDTARYFLLSLASPDKPRAWSESGIQGSLRFIKRIFNVFENVKIGKDSEEIEILINKTIKDIEQEYSSFDYRTATIKLKELFEFLEKQNQVSKPTLEKALILLHPICPHISEELWEKLGNKSFISLEKWPEYKEVKEKKEKSDINEKIINYSLDIIKKVEEKQKIKKVYLYVLPFEIKQIDKEKISGKLGKQVEIFAVNDKSKFDPENKSKKAQPGRPGIYLE